MVIGPLRADDFEIDTAPALRRGCLVFGSGLFSDQIALHAVALGAFNKDMPGFCTKMRHVDYGGRVIGQKSDMIPRLHTRQAFAQLQDGQGAEQPNGI